MITKRTTFRNERISMKSLTVDLAKQVAQSTSELQRQRTGAHRKVVNTSDDLAETSLRMKGIFVSSVLSHHATFLVNSACHLWGRRRFATGDASRNNWFVALVTLGEGWHNNHHHYQSSANQGFRWWEIDMSYCLICLLAFVGLVWDVRTPPPEKLSNVIP